MVGLGYNYIIRSNTKSEIIMKCESCKHWSQITFYTNVVTVGVCKGFPFDKITIMTRINGLDEDITNIKLIETDADFFCSGFSDKNSRV